MSVQMCVTKVVVLCPQTPVSQDEPRVAQNHVWVEFFNCYYYLILYLLKLRVCLVMASMCVWVWVCVYFSWDLRFSQILASHSAQSRTPAPPRCSALPPAAWAYRGDGLQRKWSDVRRHNKHTLMIHLSQDQVAAETFNDLQQCVMAHLKLRNVNTPQEAHRDLFSSSFFYSSEAWHVNQNTTHPCSQCN